MELKKQIFRDAVERAGSIYKKSYRQSPADGKVMIAIGADGMTVTSFNRPEWVKIDIGTEIFADTDGICHEKCDFLIDPAVLVPMLKSIADIEVGLSLSSGAVDITYGAGTFSIPVFDSESFSKMPEWNDIGADVTIGEKGFSALASAKPFISENALRPILGGICISLSDKGFHVAASDSKELFTDIVDCPSGCGIGESVIPCGMVDAMLRIMGDGKDVGMAISGQYVRFSGKDATIVSLIMQGKYPNVESIIPKSPTTRISVSKSQIAASVSRMLLACSWKRQVIRLKVADSAVVMTAMSEDDGKKGHETVQCDVFSGDDLEFAVNGDSLLKCLDAIMSDTVDMEFSGPSKAIAVKDGENPKRIILLMPCKIMD